MRQRQPTQDGCHRRSSETDRFKLNVDAAWIADSGGVGGLIRDHFNRMRISFTVALAQSLSPEHAETVTIHEGLCLAERFGYTNYTLCKVVIDQLLARFQILGPLGNIHQQILSFVDRQFVILSFDRRDINIPTHLLAAQAV